MLDCVCAVSLFILSRGEADVGFGKIGIQFNCPLVTLTGFGEFPLLLQGVSEVVMRQRESRVELNGATVKGNCLVHFSLLVQGRRQVVTVVSAVRPEPEDRAEASNELFRIARLSLRNRQIRPGINVIRLQCHSTSPGRDSLRNFALFPQGIGKVVVGFDMVGCQLDGTTKASNCIIQLLQRLVGDTQIGMKHGNAAFQAGGTKDLVCR